MKWEYQTVKLNVVGTWGVKFDVDETQNLTNQLGAEGAVIAFGSVCNVAVHVFESQISFG